MHYKALFGPGLIACLLLAVSCSNGGSSEGSAASPPSPGASGQTRGQLIQERPVEEVASDAASSQKLPLTCKPANCAPDDLAAPEVTLEGPLGVRYKLGPVIWDGDNVVSARATTTPGGSVAPDWVVAVQLDAQGTTQLLDATTRAFSAPTPQNQVGIVADGRVIQAPIVQSEISSGNILIAGDFTEEDAKALASNLSPR